MKKIEKVSIADISFTLDSDAYISLKQYLNSLHLYYDKDPDGSEIIADIEARIAELILDEQVYTKIVGKPLIDSIISQLGTPEEIEDETAAAGREPSPSTGDPSIPRRLYRSYEGKMLGGICSGMANFWDVNVAWTRLLFLAPVIMFIITAPFGWRGPQTFFLGVGWVFVVIYVVLWMAIPIAKTPRQRLESRGEKITPSKIRQNLQDVAKTPSTKKAASVFAEVLAVFGRVLLFFVKFVVAVIGFSLLIASFALFIAIIVALINPASLGLGIVAGLSGLTILSPVLFVALILFCVLLPTFVVGMALLSLVFEKNFGTVFYSIFLGLWFLAIVFCSVVVAVNAKYLRDELRGDRVSIGWSDNDSQGHIRPAGEKELLVEFLKREDDGRNTITININGNTAEIVSERDLSRDTTQNNLDGALEYRKRIVLTSPKAVEEARKELEKRSQADAVTDTLVLQQ